MANFISINNVADILGASVASISKWAKNGTYPLHTDSYGNQGFLMEDISIVKPVEQMLNSQWDKELNVIPARDFNAVELFAGAGGLALGMHKAGFKHVLLNEVDETACKTLSVNHPEWNIYHGDIHKIDFSPLKGKIDLLSGGFPCQAFSFAGKKGGFNDTRGTLFFEMARAIKEIQPKVFLAENVKGLLSHDDGKTIATIRNVIAELGYTLIEPQVLKAVMYKVPPKRERLILIGIKNEYASTSRFSWPSPYKRVMTLRDAFCQGELYDTNVAPSEGQKYPDKKKRVMSMVPEGGDWRDLPIDVQKEYMGKSFYLGGGKTGMARRLAMNEPSLTLTCAPAQKQTERCHPTETRPLTVNEYARIQTFPDDWQFAGTITQKYKQIGNAVPVNLAWAVGRSLIRLLNSINSQQPQEGNFSEVNEIAKSMLPKQQQTLPL